MKMIDIWLSQPFYNIIIIEDETLIRESIANGLKIFIKDNIKVFEVGGKKEAIELINQIDLDLAIVDYTLPDGTGVEVAQRIKERNADVPVIMITGYESDGIKEDALDVGVNIFLRKPLELTEFLSLSRNMLSLSRTKKSLINAQSVILAFNKAIEMRDKYTEGHSTRVAQYALSIFDKVNPESKEGRAALYAGCILHDIGKIAVPDYILKSTKSPLLKKDFDIIKQHPLKGYEICENIKGLKETLPIIKSHHEKLDGSGYPEGLTKKDIPEIVQIAAIADIYDALTSDRSYRKGKTPRNALTIMEREAKEGKINKSFFKILKSLVGINK